MRISTLTALTAVGLIAFALPAAAVPAGPVTGISSSSDLIANVRMKRRRMSSRTQAMKPGASGVRNKTPGAPAGSGGGNGATGSVAAPSGK